MKILLDTHTFIWWDSEPEKLSNDVLGFLCQPEIVRFVSVVSLWEIQIKHQLGKLEISKPLQEIYESQSRNGISFLPMSPKHIFNLSVLPHHHKDPFDRMLIAQALSEDLTIISRDEKFKLHGLPLITP